MQTNPQPGEVPSSMTQLDIMLPSQHFGPRRKQAPELRLMLAVFQDALDCIEKYRFAEDPRGRQLFDEAKYWFLADETDWPYSFVCICGVLDLDSNAVRQRLRLAPKQRTHRRTMPYGFRQAEILKPLKSGSNGDSRHTADQRRQEQQ